MFRSYDDFTNFVNKKIAERDPYTPPPVADIYWLNVEEVDDSDYPPLRPQ